MKLSTSIHPVAYQAIAGFVTGMMVFTPGTLRAQDSLATLLRANRHAMNATVEGRLAGEGAKLLIDAGRQSQFFLIGEEHGVAQIPLITGALYSALVPHGYRHLAIETGDVLASRMNREILADRTGAAYLSFLRKHWPGAPFYNWREEAALLTHAVQASGRRRDVLWGLDYDIVGDRVALLRLRDIAPNARARAAAEKTIARANLSLDSAMDTRNPGLLFMFGGPDDMYAELRSAYRPTRGSEAEQIIHLLEETRAINGLFFSRKGYESNDRRALLNKRRFMRYLDEAKQTTGSMPRVMLKFGASHMVRGRTYVNVFDLGSMASELADLQGRKSFGVLMVGGMGSTHAVVDPTVMKSSPAPAEFPPQAWMKPFYDAAFAEGWTVFDMRPIRATVGRLGVLPDRTLQAIFGFDALVILTGSTPSRDLDIPRPKPAS